MNGFKHIPQELCDRPQWVVWRIVERDGKSTKVPFQVSGEPAKSNDSATWTTFQVAIAAEVFDGIGFVFSHDDPYCGIDFDSCRDAESGKVETWARDEILKLSSYAEVSPSQSGVKVIVRAKWHGDWHQHKMKNMTSTTDKVPQIEVYDALRFFALTGIVLQGQSRIADRQVAVDDLLERCEAQRVSIPVPPPDFRSAGAVFQRARRYLSKLPGAISGQGGHNVTFHAACILVLGFGLCRDEAITALTEWNSVCQPPWSERELAHKVEGALAQPGDRNYLRNVKPENYASVKTPIYQSPIAPHVPESTTLQEATLRYVAAVRDGIQRPIDTGLPELDYALGGGVEAGELVILAGRPSHGKSAIALQMVHHWTLEGLPTLLISEEMSAIALGKRVVQFASNVPQEYWEVRNDSLTDEVNKHFHDRAECRLIESCKSAEAVTEAVRAAVREIKCKCVVVDYAQLLSSAGKSRYEQVTNTSVALRQIATETKVVLLALCQLSRAIEHRDKFIPKNSDLKETGQLEQDADVIIFGVWPHRIDKDRNPHEYQLWVSKNRNRPINQNCIDVKFEPSRQKFTETVPSYNNHAATSASDDF